MRARPCPFTLMAQAKLRTDLVISRQEAPEGSYFVVKDPTTGRFFRLKEIEYFIAEQLDGATPADVVRGRVEERFGAPLAAESLEQFVATLSRLGLLEGETAGAVRAAPGHGRVRGDFLYLRFKVFDPDRLLNFLVQRLRFLFTPHFLALSAFLILCAFAVTLFGWEEFKRDLRTLYRFDALFLAWVTMLGVVTLHEFAHGLTCKRFGGAVHELGFMLIYFQPAFYCNVSDAWLFPEKSKRLWVTFAGAYFEIFLWALATLAWRLSDPEAWIHFLALVIMATSGIKTLFNLNPLIKLDGYYLLSDYLEIPNLRQKAFGFMGDRIRRLLGSSRGAAREISDRERRIYSIYGLSAGFYSFSLLGFVVVNLGGYLIGRYEAYGFILFTLLLAAVFRRPLGRIFDRPVTALRSTAGKVRISLRLVRAVVILAVIPAVLFLARMELRVSGDFRVLPVHNADIRAEVEGIIERIYVKEGDRVREGDIVARLVERDYRADLHKTAAEIDEKSAKLKKLKVGPIPEEIKVARAQLAKSEDQFRYARRFLDTNRAAFERQLISRRELEQSEEQAAVREKELQEAKGKLELLLAGSRKEEIEGTEAEIARLEAQKHHLQEQVKLSTLTSPITGVVTTPRRQLKELVGQYMKKGDLVAEVYELKTITAEIAVSEREIADVQIGNTVAVKARAYPGETFYGKVISIATTANIGQDDKANPGPGSGRADVGEKGAVLVATQIDNRSLLLKPEMTGKAKIFCGERSVFDLTARRLARTFAVELWSWW